MNFIQTGRISQREKIQNNTYSQRWIFEKRVPLLHFISFVIFPWFCRVDVRVVLFTKQILILWAFWAKDVCLSITLTWVIINWVPEKEILTCDMSPDLSLSRTLYLKKNWMRLGIRIIHTARFWFSKNVFVKERIFQGTSQKKIRNQFIAGIHRCYLVT